MMLGLTECLLVIPTFSTFCKSSSAVCELHDSNLCRSIYMYVVLRAIRRNVITENRDITFRLVYKLMFASLRHK